MTRFDRLAGGSGSEDPDGYYWRDATGRLRGPMTRFQFESYSLRGHIQPGAKVWRQQGANHYKVEITRRVRWRKLLSPRGCGAVMEWTMMLFTLLALLFLCTLKKLRDELSEELKENRGMAIFLFSLFALTLLLSIGTMRKLSGRVAVEACDVCDAEC